MNLIDVVVGVSLVLAIWWLPGVLLGWALGLGWRSLIVMGPLISLGLLTVAGLWSGILGLPWNLPSVVVLVVVLTVVVRIGRALVGRWRRSRGTSDSGSADRPSDTQGQGASVTVATLSGRRMAVVGLGVGLGVVIGAWTWWQATHGMTLINQDWDIPWHANMVRLIAQTQEWSTGLAGNFAYYDTVVEDAPIRNYPIAFHAVIALVWPVSGLAVPEFLSVVQLVLVAVQIPLSAAALTWFLSRRSGATALAGLAAAMLSSFPYDLLFRGPLVPLVAGLSLLGPFLVAAIRAGRTRRATWVLVAAVGAVGLFGAHASIAVFAVVMLVIWIALATPWTLREVGLRTLGLIPVGVLAALMAGPLILEMLREAGRVGEVQWPAYETVPQAVGEVLLLSHGSGMAQWGWAVLVLVGCYVLVRRPALRWYGASYAVAVLFAAYTAGSDGALITDLTAFVYNDSWRLVGVATLLAVPVIGIGGQQVYDSVRAWWRSRELAPGSRAPAVGLTATLLVAALVLVAVVRADITRNIATLQRNYREGATVSAEERTMMESLTAIVPEDGQVLNDACDGSAWMFALSDRMPMIRHFEIVPTDRQLLLLLHFDEFDSNPDVRQAAAELGITHVYVGSGGVRTRLVTPAGLTDLDDVSALHLVEENSAARVYELDWSQVPGGLELFESTAKDRERREGVPGIWESGDPAPLVDQNAVCV